MSQNSCCVPGCLVTKKDGIPLHRFPNPDLNAEKFNTWIAKIGGEIATMDNFVVYSNRRVCHNHFQEIDKYPRNRLCKLAIPVLYLPEQLHTESVTLPLPSTSGIQKIESDIHMKDQLFMAAVCSISDVQETQPDFQMREHLHTESVTLSALSSTSGVRKTQSDIHMKDQLSTEPVTVPALCSISGVQVTPSHFQRDFDCSKRWAYVRDYYIRRKCKTGNNRTGSSGEAAKKRADLLSFLDGFTLTQRNRVPKDDDENTGDHSETMEYPEVNIERKQSHYQGPTEMMYDEDETNTQDSNNSDDATNNTVSKEYCDSKREKKLNNTNSHSLERNPVQNELDETDLFFQSMAKIVKKLPRYDQAHLRMQFGSLIGNAELSYISSNLSQNRDFSRRPGTSGFPVPSSGAIDLPDVVPYQEAGSTAVNDQEQNIFHFTFKQEEI